MNCEKCDNVLKRGIINYGWHHNVYGNFFCPECVKNKKCDCEYCE